MFLRITDTLPAFAQKEQWLPLYLWIRCFLLQPLPLSWPSHRKAFFFVFRQLVTASRTWKMITAPTQLPSAPWPFLLHTWCLVGSWHWRFCVMECLWFPLHLSTLLPTHPGNAPSSISPFLPIVFIRLAHSSSFIIMPFNIFRAGTEGFLASVGTVIARFALNAKETCVVASCPVSFSMREHWNMLDE